MNLFALLFILTGVFAIAGGLYTWGDGSIFDQTELLIVLIPWADVILTGPVSIITGLGLFKKKSWAVHLGSFTSGIYVFGSALVFISMMWKRNLELFLIIPAVSGLFIGIGFLISQIMSRKRELSLRNE